MSTTASLANDSLLSQCADFIETMLHRFLKAESEKPTPPTPAELQPAVNTLWRLSTIRKNLSPKPSPSSNPVNPSDPVILSKSVAFPTPTPTPTHTPTQADNLSPAQIAFASSPNAPIVASSSRNLPIAHRNPPSENSVSSVAPCNHFSPSSLRNSEFDICNSPASSPAPTIKEVLASIRQLESATRAAQREAKLRAAQSQPAPALRSSPPSVSPPSSASKFRYPPPKRTSV